MVGVLVAFFKGIFGEKMSGNNLGTFCAKSGNYFIQKSGNPVGAQPTYFVIPDKDCKRSFFSIAPLV